MTSEEDKLKKKMMERQQEAMQSQMMHQAAAQQNMIGQQMEMLKAIMTEVLDPKARERLNNLKLVKPDVATQIQLYLAQAYQAGQIRGKITDDQLVLILKQVSGEKKNFKITRK